MTGLNDTDIRLNSEWQLTQATDGDAPLCSGLECLYQNIVLEALTQPGDVFYDAEFGWGVLDVGRAANGPAQFAWGDVTVSFTGTSMDLKLLAGAYAAVTAPAPVLPIAQALAVELGCEPVVVAEDDRVAYAEAIATATDFSHAIVAQASALLRDAGVGNPGSYLSALVHSTVAQALSTAGRDPALG